MNKKRLKRMAAMMMAMVLTVCAATPAGSFAFASGVDVQSNTAEKTVTEESREPELYDSTLRKELEAVEVATAVDIVVAAGYGFDVEHDFEGISYNENMVKVSYYADKGSFDGNKAGEYETYYKIVPISGKEPYLICRTISVREPETAKTADVSSDSGKTGDGEDEQGEAEVPDLAEGEMPELTTDNPVTFKLTSEAVMMAATFNASTERAASKDSMKVSNDGYAAFCGRRMGVKYISESGDYHNHLVYCLDMNKNTTNGTVSSSASTSKIKPTITYCLVNGARKLNGKCYNDKYSSGNAKEDYFITGAAIHVLNGEVGLSYYNNGSSTYKKIASMVEDAKKHGDDYADNGLTKSVTYSISPKKSEWKDMGDGLYRSADKFVRTKKGTITDVKYTITGAPAGLTVGEIKTDSSEIEDENDLKKYDICVAQTDASKESSNFYLFCNEDALKKIQEQKATIKVTGKAYADEKGGRKWTPTVVSQQKITFLEEFNVKSDEATVKVTSEYKLGKFELLKTDKFTNGPVENAKYYLYEDQDCDDLFCKLSATNGKGLAATDVEVLTQDTYYLKEVLELDGYQKDETVYPVGLEYFTLYDGNGKVIQKGKQMPVKETPDKVGVLVNKTDSDSGNIVAGAGFAVFKDAGCTQRVLTEGSSGAEVPIFYYDEDLDMAASEKFVKEQETYYVKEVVIPDGYRDDGKVYNVSPIYGEFQKVLAPVAMLVMMEAIQQRIIDNGRKGRATWLYIDECHVLLNSDYSATYLQQLWKKVRKQGGLCTGITQNVTDLLQNYVAMTLLSNSEFVALLKQANVDSAKLAEVIGVSDAQLQYVSNSASGTGLLKCGSIVIPFDNQIGKDSDLYKLYNTNIHEKIAMGLVNADTSVQSCEMDAGAQFYEMDEVAEPTKIYEPKRKLPHAETEYDGVFASEPKPYLPPEKHNNGGMGMIFSEENKPEPQGQDNNWMIYG